MNTKKIRWFRVSAGLCMLSLLVGAGSAPGYTYTLPDTDQSLCYDSLNTISFPYAGEPFYGQDAQYNSEAPDYTNNGDGTVSDLNTGLMWQQGLDQKMTWDDAVAGASICTIGGYTDWRLPSVKELYSLILFSGTDPSGPSPSNPVPFIDIEYFEFEYGDTLSGERLIDAQYWSSTVYQGLTMVGDSTAFGVNFADGRIKGYPRDVVGQPGRDFQMTSFVRYVRGNGYAENQFSDNGDGTITDLATGLMWQQSDDSTGRNWQEALEYAETLTLAGETDWRLPNVHELQSIVDYTRSLQETDSPSIDPMFSCSEITDEGGTLNYGFYWTGTTHANANLNQTGQFAAYVTFGEALGWMMTPDSTYTLRDVHGAGAQRSDPKTGDPDDYPYGHGPQGDVVRIYNLVRCVRNADGTGISEESESAAASIEISGSNPFSNSISLNCILPIAEHITLNVFDSSGRIAETLVNRTLSEGIHSFCWNPSGSNFKAGIYFCRLSTTSGNSVVKVVYSN